MKVEGAKREPQIPFRMKCLGRTHPVAPTRAEVSLLFVALEPCEKCRQLLLGVGSLVPSLWTHAQPAAEQRAKRTAGRRTVLGEPELRWERMTHTDRICSLLVLENLRIGYVGGRVCSRGPSGASGYLVVCARRSTVRGMSRGRALTNPTD